MNLKFKNKTSYIMQNVNGLKDCLKESLKEVKIRKTSDKSD